MSKVGNLEPDSGQAIDTPAECPLCKILDNETLEQVFQVAYELSGRKFIERFFIVTTKNKKGHVHRYMVVLDGHNRIVSQDAENQAIAEFFKFMKRFGVDFAIMESTHATIAGHWHRVATDLHPMAEDVKQIGDTDRFEIRFKKAGG